MSSGEFRLFVGLGNPGTKYKKTRHNIGFMALENFALQQNTSFQKNSKLHGHLAEIGIGENRIRLLLPNTFMNESGIAVRAAIEWFDLKTSQLIVVVDDMDLPLGKLRLRSQGSSGGHNGLKSVIHHLGTQNFCRIRIGIGAPSSIPEEKRAKTISHVLGNFQKNEKELINKVINEVNISLDTINQEGIEKAGNRLNSYQI